MQQRQRKPLGSLAGRLAGTQTSIADQPTHREINKQTVELVIHRETCRRRSVDPQKTRGRQHDTHRHTDKLAHEVGAPAASTSTQQSNSPTPDNHLHIRLPHIIDRGRTATAGCTAHAVDLVLGGPPQPDLVRPDLGGHSKSRTGRGWCSSCYCSTFRS